MVLERIWISQIFKFFSRTGNDAYTPGTVERRGGRRSAAQTKCQKCNEVKPSKCESAGESSHFQAQWTVAISHIERRQNCHSPNANGSIAPDDIVIGAHSMAAARSALVSLVVSHHSSATSSSGMEPMAYREYVSTE